jgi:hypothetical protein
MKSYDGCGFFEGGGIVRSVAIGSRCDFFYIFMICRRRRETQMVTVARNSDLTGVEYLLFSIAWQMQNLKALPW